MCNADEDAGYALVQVVGNGETEKRFNGDFVLLVGDFKKLGGSEGFNIKTVDPANIRAALRSISFY